MRFFDLHIDTLAKAIEPDDGGAATAVKGERVAAGLLLGSEKTAVDWPRLEQAHACGAVWAACDDEHRGGGVSAARVLRMLIAGNELAARGGSRLRLILSAADLEAAMCATPVASETEQGPPARPGAHPIAMLLAVEGAHSLAGSLEMLSAFHALGLRLLTLTWNHANPFGAGCYAPPEEDQGLTLLGRELLARADALGIVIDLAHASPKTFATTLEQMKAAGRPPLVSHTACAGLRPHPRNLTDDQLRAIAEAGGVAGITFCAPFLAEREPDRDAVIAHIRHALSIAGSDAVAIGTDFDGAPLPAGISGVQDMPAFFLALETAGLSRDQVEKIAWKNALRVLAAGLPGGTR